MTFIVAHRGLSSKAPENTYYSFDLAIARGVNHIEFDVQLTKDKEIVIIHDEAITRTSDGQGMIKEKTFNQLLEFDFGSWFSKEFSNAKIPKFSDVLDKYKNVNFVIEIKSAEPELVERVMSVISSNKYWESKIFKSKNENPKIIFCSFIPEQIKALRKFSNDIVVGFLVKEISERVFSFSKEFDLDGIFPFHKLIDEESLKKLKKEKYLISSWGFQHIEEAYRLIELGVDGITVDWPDEV